MKLGKRNAKVQEECLLSRKGIWYTMGSMWSMWWCDCRTPQAFRAFLGGLGHLVDCRVPLLCFGCVFLPRRINMILSNPVTLRPWGYAILTMSAETFAVSQATPRDERYERTFEALNFRTMRLTCGHRRTTDKCYFWARSAGNTSDETEAACMSDPEW